MGDQEDQHDELMALTNIIDEEIFMTDDNENDPGGHFYAHVHLPKQFFVILDEADCDTKPGMHEIEFLPPLMLNFQLPPDYPSVNAPTFTLSCKWLSLDQLSLLCKKLDEIWEENRGSVILFLWTTFLQDDTYAFLELKSPLNLSHILCGRRTSNPERCARKHDRRAIQDIALQSLLPGVLLEYNTYQRGVAFDKSLISCGVCFCEKYGSQCSRFFPCKHAFCKECMGEYFRVQIADGNVAGISCPHDGCSSDASPSQVKELVAADMFARYDSLLLEMSLQTMVDIIYCPRVACQTAVIFDRESGMATCPSCGFVFCPLCKLTYHGVSPCRIKRQDIRKLRDEYLNADATTQAYMERRYGKNVLTRILHEAFSEDWLQENSQKCPKCGSNIQKVDGCNKMTCTKCRSFFCWLCSQPLSRNNPYSHFNDPGSPCFTQLFTGVEDEDEADDVGFA